MIRHLIQKDVVSRYVIIYDEFIARPYKEETDLEEGDKVLINIIPETDPFIYMFHASKEVTEWWFIVGKKASKNQDKLYDIARTMFQKQFLQLRA